MYTQAGISLSVSADIYQDLTGPVVRDFVPRPGPLKFTITLIRSGTAAESDALVTAVHETRFLLISRILPAATLVCTK